MSSSAVYTIQKHSFYFLFPSCIVDMFEDKSKSLKIIHHRTCNYVTCDMMLKNNSKLPMGKSGNNNENDKNVNK